MRRMYSKEQLIKLIKDNSSEPHKFKKITAMGLYNSTALFTETSLLNNNTEVDELNNIYYIDGTIQGTLASGFDEVSTPTNIANTQHADFTKVQAKIDGIDYKASGYAVVSSQYSPTTKIVPVYLYNSSVNDIIQIIPSDLAAFKNDGEIVIHFNIVLRK